ncbi:ATP-dependent DNA helicase [Paenibacillus sp. R14(2021)]|uniref:ATP-dependent DNA helicase n=1 Tax=Paenibacillus sp. R14(2021) TaxID=2859228 RepID=UPI001C6160BC|nr:ATP-dependent DNA helicase [Paenibacillus sp. R14(2021)]
MDHTIQLSVRALVEYAYRSGDIESGFRTSASLTDGTKAHQRVQKQYGEQDEREVYVSAEIVMDDLLFVVDGRCDGLLAGGEDGIVVIDEIKSTSGSLPEMVEATYPVHWAQAKCYAYMVATDRALEQIAVQLTYVQVQSEEERRFRQQFTRGELELFLHDMIRSYYASAAQQVRHRLKRDASIKMLPFPFPAYREGQRKLAGAVYKSVVDGQKLFAKAPTGIGKTISTIFPAVKAVGEGLLQRVVYLTAKTIARKAAEDAFGLLQSKGLHMAAVTLTAKEKICFQEEVRCSKEHCPYAEGYYDRINEALLDLRTKETLMTREVIEQYARKHRVCPFEFSLDAAYGADAIICDYNYVFDPRVSLKRMFEEQKRRTAVLVDEAHNLVDRAREMYSSELNKSAFLDVQRAYKGVNAEVYGAAKAVNDYLLTQRKRIGERLQEAVEEPPEELTALVEQFVDRAERALLGAARSGGGAGRLDSGSAEVLDLFGSPAEAVAAAVPQAGTAAGSAALLELYYACQNFVRTAKLYDERYVTYTECDRSEVRIKLFCLDPSHLLRTMGKGYRSTVFFSATLTPLSYYMDMLGSDDEGDYSVVIPSPFSREQLDVFISPLSTRYQDRERTKEPIVSLISRITGQRKGNYLLFFPSYAYMNDAYERFAVQQEKRPAEAEAPKTIVQGTRMTEAEREQFLAAFQSSSEETLVGFAVMGGIFAEGIDLVGDRLTGVVVVGVGLPQIGLERDIMKAYFDGTGRNGFDYAFLFPGMNKVLQAGGRLIRSEDDRGILLLIDDRYLQPQYNRLLPQEWLDYTIL